MKLSELNHLTKEAFVSYLEGIYEHSSWVAAHAESARPIKSAEHLHQCMKLQVKEASTQVKLDLIRAHPDLGSRLHMSDDSQHEQQGAGLHELTEAEFTSFQQANESYKSKFGFPFILAVKGRGKTEIYQQLTERLENDQQTEFETALNEIDQIAWLRLKEKITEGVITVTERKMLYGKGDVFVYRTYMKPLVGVKNIPESSFTGRPNELLGLNVSVSVKGSELLTSFTEGDNSKVVATDSMKNFIQRKFGSYDGSTAEGFVSYCAKEFLERYDHFDQVSMTAEEVMFEDTIVGQAGVLKRSGLVFKQSRNEKASASVEVTRTENGLEITSQSSALHGLQMIKIRGNAFAGFVQDEYTTLPETSDRPLFVYLNLEWEYQDYEAADGSVPDTYVAAEQVRDIAAAVFHSYSSPSIQSLIYKIGCRVLQRFPQLKNVTFQSQNHTWETVIEEIPETEGRVYMEPRPPYGFQVFTITQADAQKEAAAAEAAFEEQA